MALLGEMHFTPPTGDSWFNLPRASGIAYTAQESWVQNETIRDNIVFGAPCDEKRCKEGELPLHGIEIGLTLTLFSSSTMCAGARS